MDEFNFTPVQEPSVSPEDIEDFIAAPKKQGGFLNIITMQAIICTIVMISAVILGTVAPSKLEYCRKKYQTLVSVDAPTFFRVVNEKYTAVINGGKKNNVTSDNVNSVLGVVSSTSSGNTSSKPATSSTKSTSSNKQTQSSSSETSKKTSSKSKSKQTSSVALTDAGGTPTPVFNLSATPVNATVLPVNLTINFQKPINTGKITSLFGHRIHPITGVYEFHTALDIGAPKNTPVHSVADGKVLISSKTATIGNYVFIKHADGFYSRYGHLNKRCVKKGDKVKAGQLIGKVGTTGLSTGYHLHLQLFKNKLAFNPSFVFQYARN